MLAGLFDDLPSRDGTHEHKPLDSFIIRLSGHSHDEMYFNYWDTLLSCGALSVSRGLSPVQTQKHTITRLLHQHAFALCVMRDI